MREIKIVVWFSTLWFRQWHAGFRRGLVPHLGCGPKLGKCCISSQIEMEILPNPWKSSASTQIVRSYFWGCWDYFKYQLVFHCEGMTSKHLEKSQSVKPRAASVVRDMPELTLARTGAVTAEPSAMVSFPWGRHLMDILGIPGDYWKPEQACTPDIWESKHDSFTVSPMAEMGSFISKLR